MYTFRGLMPVKHSVFNSVVNVKVLVGAFNQEIVNTLQTFVLVTWKFLDENVLRQRRQGHKWMWIELEMLIMIYLIISTVFRSVVSGQWSRVTCHPRVTCHVSRQPRVTEASNLTHFKRTGFNV